MFIKNMSEHNTMSDLVNYHHNSKLRSFDGLLIKNMMDQDGIFISIYLKNNCLIFCIVPHDIHITIIIYNRNCVLQLLLLKNNNNYSSVL